jgi:vancomycin permeability regulator SanA
MKVIGASALMTAALIGTSNWYVIDGNGIVARTVAGAPVSDVALVPGCYANGLRPAAVLKARLSAALGLYRAGRVRQILVTGDGPKETNAMQHWLVEQGTPAADVIVDNYGTRTIESARRAADVYGVHTAVICTQKLNLARALFLVERAGIHAVGFEAAIDFSDSVRWQLVEALKRTSAFGEVVVLGRLDSTRRPTVATN